MKILRVIPSMDPTQGGPCQGIRNSIPALLKFNGEHNEVVTLDAVDKGYQIQDNFKIHKVGQRTGPWQYHKDLIPWLLANVLDYNVVVIHGLWSYHSWAVHKAIQKLKKQNKKVPKTVVMPHGMLDPYFQKAKSRKLKALRNELYWRFFESKVVNKADALFFTCEEELLLARTTFKGYYPKQEINVGYGIQAPPSKSANTKEVFKGLVPQWDEKPYFLFLSRIHSKKGVDLLLKAYNALLQTNPDVPQLMIAGPGMDTTYGDELRNLVEAKDKIIFTGMLKGEAKWAAFYEAEMFILPSHQENFGIAVVEALACKLPVLISNKVNIWREIKNGGGGLVAEDSLQGTQSMLREWNLFSDSQKQQYSENAFKVYEKNYTVNAAAKELQKAFELLVTE